MCVWVCILTWCSILPVEVVLEKVECWNGLNAVCVLVFVFACVCVAFSV